MISRKDFNVILFNFEGQRYLERLHFQQSIPNFDRWFAWQKILPIWFPGSDIFLSFGLQNHTTNIPTMKMGNGNLLTCNIFMSMGSWIFRNMDWSMFCEWCEISRILDIGYTLKSEIQGIKLTTEPIPSTMVHMLRVWHIDGSTEWPPLMSDVRHWICKYSMANILLISHFCLIIHHKQILFIYKPICWYDILMI